MFCCQDELLQQLRHSNTKKALTVMQGRQLLCDTGKRRPAKP